jgi:hypothetical protein
MNESVDQSFDLEQQILDCWTITSQLDTLVEGVLEHDMSTDQITNVLIGLKELYNLKFDKAFNTFEHVHQAVLKASK